MTPDDNLASPPHGAHSKVPPRWRVPDLKFHSPHSKSTKGWHLVNNALQHSASENYFSRNEFQLISQAKGINKYYYHQAYLHPWMVGVSSLFQVQTSMGGSALKNVNFEGQSYLVTDTKMGNSIHFGQKIVNHRPVVNSDALASSLCRRSTLFGLASNSPRFFFAVVLAPICRVSSLFPSSGHLRLFTSENFTQLGRSAGGSHYFTQVDA